MKYFICFLDQSIFCLHHNESSNKNRQHFDLEKVLVPTSKNLQFLQFFKMKEYLCFFRKLFLTSFRIKLLNKYNIFPAQHNVNETKVRKNFAPLQMLLSQLISAFLQEAESREMKRQCLFLISCMGPKPRSLVL